MPSLSTSITLPDHLIVFLPYKSYKPAFSAASKTSFSTVSFTSFALVGIPVSSGAERLISPNTLKDLPSF